MCDRSGQPVVTSWGKTREPQSSFFHEKTQHEGTAQSVVNEEKPHDRTGQPFVIPQREMIFDECHRKRRKTFCDMVNVHVCNIGIISSVHGKELLRQFGVPSRIQKISQ